MLCNLSKHNTTYTIQIQTLRPRGNQKGSGQLPTLWVLILAHVYTNHTGLKPTTTAYSKKPGGFVDFLLAVRDTFDIPLGDEAVHRAVKIALRSK